VRHSGQDPSPGRDVPAPGLIRARSSNSGARACQGSCRRRRRASTPAHFTVWNQKREGGRGQLLLAGPVRPLVVPLQCTMIDTG
jgi:hypothetical protein